MTRAAREATDQVFCDRLEVEMTVDDTGGNVPGLARAIGHVVARQVERPRRGARGATGTVVWADPEWDLICALFTTQPGAPRSEVSNAVLGALS